MTQTKLEIALAGLRGIRDVSTNHPDAIIRARVAIEQVEDLGRDKPTDLEQRIEHPLVTGNDEAE